MVNTALSLSCAVSIAEKSIRAENGTPPSGATEAREAGKGVHKDLAEKENEEDGNGKDGENGGPNHRPDADRAVVVGPEPARLREVCVERLRTLERQPTGSFVNATVWS